MDTVRPVLQVSSVCLCPSLSPSVPICLYLCPINKCLRPLRGRQSDVSDIVPGTVAGIHGGTVTWTTTSVGLVVRGSVSLIPGSRSAAETTTAETARVGTGVVFSLTQRLLCCVSSFCPCSSVCPGGVEAPCGNHGDCDDGVRGSGSCKCHKGFRGQSCDSCASGYYGNNCTGMSETNGPEPQRDQSGGHAQVFSQIHPSQSPFVQKLIPSL